jgi:hypothetical protein
MIVKIQKLEVRLTIEKSESTFLFLTFQVSQSYVHQQTQQFAA